MRLLAQHSPSFDPSVPWKDLSEEVRAESRLFRQLALWRRSPHVDRDHEFTRLSCPEWVNVIAFRAPELGGELLAVEQFRHGIDAPTLEIIGGVCEPGEDPALSAQRELREETGHEAEAWVPLGWCTPNPAVQDNRCHFFLATGCRPVGELELDPCEELRVWAVPLPEWERQLAEGTVHHALVLAAWARLMLWDGWPRLRRRLEGEP